MKQIFKSYLKSYFKNWIEAVGLIIFIVIIIATIAGILSGALQYKIKYNDLYNVSRGWDYYYVGSSDPSEYKKDFIENYYVNNLFYDKNNLPVKVTGTNEAIIDDQSTWWTSVKTVCDARPTQAAQEICRNTEIINKVNEVRSNRGTGQPIGGLNPIAIQYLKNFNYNRSYELVKRLLTASQTSDWTSSFFESISLTQQIDNNFVFNITPAVVPSIDNQPTNFNNVKLYQGQLPTADNEVVISNLFADKNNFKIGDNLSVLPNKPQFNLKIVGIGNNLDNFIHYTSSVLKPSSNNDLNKYGVLFTTTNYLINLQDANANQQLNQVKYSLSQKSFIKLNSASAILPLKEALAPAYITPTSALLAFSDGTIAQQTQNINIQIILYSAIGSILLFLGFIFINYTMKKEMNKTRRQIGIFKAFGYLTLELSWVFSLKFLITMLFGVLIGYCFSIPIQLYVNTLYTTGLLISFSMIYAPWQFMIILFLVVPLFFTALSFLFTLVYLKKPSLDLINGGGKIQFNFLTAGIKKIFNKTNFVFRVQLAFTLKSFTKWLIVMFIFFISSLLFIIQFNASDIFTEIVNSLSNIYQKDVDHRFRFPKYLMQADQTMVGGEEFLQLTNNNNFQVFPTTNVEQEQEKSLTEFKIIANNIHEIKENGGPYCLAGLAAFTTYVPIYKSVYLNDLWQVIDDLSSCASMVPDWFKDISNLKSLIDQSTVQTVVSFNTLYYNPNTELPVISLAVASSATETAVMDDTRLNGIEANNWQNFFKMSGVSLSVIDEIFSSPITKTEIPAIISEKMAKLGNLKIGDTFEFTVKYASSQYNISIKVKSIIKNDTSHRSIFVNAATLRHIYRDFNGQMVPKFYNGLISKEKIVRDKINPVDLLAGKQNYKVTLQNLTINIFNHNVTDSLIKIIGATTNNGSDISIFTGTSNVDLISLQKILANAGLNILNDSLLILQILNGLIIFIILAVITSSVIDEASQIILTMRALGYKPRQVNFIIIGNYVIGIILVFAFAYLISLVIWSFAVNIILNQFRFVINIPLNWQTPLKSGSIIMIILVLSWMLSMYLVKKRKLNELTE